MPVHSAPKIEILAKASDPKKALLDALGDLSGIEVLSDLVLIGTFIRNERTAGGIIRPLENVQEDEHQGKAGLVLKTGPNACGDWEEGAELGQNAKLGTWVVYQIAHSWPLQVNGVPCRLIPYDKLRMRVNDPNVVF